MPIFLKHESEKQPSQMRSYKLWVGDVRLTDTTKAAASHTTRLMKEDQSISIDRKYQRKSNA